MIQDFHLNLAAVRVAGKGKLDAKFGSAIKRIGIVGEENVGHVAAHERLDTREKLLSLPATVVLALVIHADEIEFGPVECNLRVGLTEQIHARLRIEISRFILRVRVDLMIAIATPGAQRSMQTANFLDAVGNRIPGASDQIARNHGDVRAQIIGHIHGAADLRAGHVTAQVNVA